MDPIRVQTGEYLPDLPVNNNPGALVALNVLPGPLPGIYKPLAGLNPFSDALPSRVLGAKPAKSNDGNIFLFAGTGTKLYKINGTAWDDISRASNYVTGAEERWNFVQFGQTMVAMNYIDEMQSYTMGSSSLFANLSGAPKARYGAVVGDFFMVGNINDGTAKPTTVKWPTINSLTTWTTGGASQAGSQEFADGGWVRGLVGGSNYATVLQENCIRRGSYIGPPYFFRFDKVVDQKGVYAPGSIISIGNMIFFLAEDGFYRYDGQTIYPIGQGKVNKTFFADASLDYILSRMQGGIDPINTIVFWTYASRNAPAGQNDKIIMHNYTTGCWATGEVDSTYFFSALQPGYTLETLDSYGSSSSIDTLPFTLDSRVWQGGASLLAAFNSDNKLSFFTGSNLEAIIDTGETQLFSGRWCTVKEVRAITDTNSVSIAIGYREKVGDTVAFTAYQAQDASGKADLRITSRYQRVRTKIAAGAAWTDMQAVEIIPEQAGKR